ncbi:MAG: class I SAM-dependent methyltransferase [Pseudobdellovibrionaceae bacterium]
MKQHDSKLDLSWVPKGNTVKGVNVLILQFLLSKKKQLNSLFDIPCGDGSFLFAVKQIFPRAFITGLDLYAQPREDIKELTVKASAKDWPHVQNKNFDIITSISGVMAFDDVSGLFERAYQHLNPNGYFIITNDNILTIRDRLHFLLFGSVKRFPLCFQTNEGNWNIIMPQALWRLGKCNGFELEKVTYHSPRIEDWFWLPLSIVIYPLQFLYLVLQKTDKTFAEKLKIFPPQILWKRHYIFYFRKI